jgi:hypothetical protein
MHDMSGLMFITRPSLTTLLALIFKLSVIVISTPFPDMIFFKKIIMAYCIPISEVTSMHGESIYLYPVVAKSASIHENMYRVQLTFRGCAENHSARKQNLNLKDPACHVGTPLTRGIYSRSARKRNLPVFSPGNEEKTRQSHDASDWNAPGFGGCHGGGGRCLHRI